MPEEVFEHELEGLRGRSVRGAAVTAVAQICKFILLLASQVALAHFLNPADFGIIAMVAPILGFVGVLADLGLLQAVVQLPVITYSQLNSIFWINVLFSLFLALVLAACAPLFVWLYGNPTLFDVTIALSSLTFFTGLSLLQVALLNRMMRFTALAISEVASLTAAVAVGVLAAWQGYGYWSLVLSQAANTFTSGAIVWSASRWRPGKPNFKAKVLGIFRFGGNITLSNIAGYLNTTLDNLLIGLFIGEIALGLYDRAWKLAVLPLTQLLSPVNRVAMPTLSRLVKDENRYRNAFSQMLQVLLLAGLPGLTVAALEAGPLIALFFGSKWAEIAPVFSWLCIGALVSLLNASLFWLFVSQGRTREDMTWGATASAINVLAYAAGLHWGLIGVARTSAISVYVLQTPLLFWAATRTGPVRAGTLIRIVYPFVMATVVAMVAITILPATWTDRGFFGLVLATIVSYSAFTAVLAVLKPGRSALRSAWNVRAVLMEAKRTSLG